MGQPNDTDLSLSGNSLSTVGDFNCLFTALGVATTMFSSYQALWNKSKANFWTNEIIFICLCYQFNCFDLFEFCLHNYILHSLVHFCYFFFIVYFSIYFKIVGQKCTEFDAEGPIIQENSNSCINASVPCPVVYISTDAYKCMYICFLPPSKHEMCLSNS